MNNKFRLSSTLVFSALSINSALALPIDWTGVFGVDTHLLNNTCLTKTKVDENLKPIPGATPPGTGVRNGTQAIRNGDCNSSFQTYTLRLNPNIIINDGVTLKGEISSGYLRGGFAGGDSANNADGSGNNSYFFTTPAQRSALNVNQMYMELYADTALIKIGRFSRHFGMGMTFDNGNDPWDRFLTMYDGIEAEMKIGNFSVTPHFAKISSYNGNNNNNNSNASGAQDVRELGLTAKYDNKNKDFIASVIYAKRSSEPQNKIFTTNSTTSTGDPRGSTSVSVIEPYVAKKWNKLKVSAEGTIQTGDYGRVDSSIGKAKIDAKAFILDVKYDLNPKWDIGAMGGQVSGDKGSTNKFEATYLHPNFHVADLMFRYNYAGFTEGGRSVFDASITNAQFYKLYGNYKTDKWTWKSAFIIANALETAKSGSRSFQHQENYSYAADAHQDDNYGWELDLGFDYRWNPNVIISGYYGYWNVGDYFSFTNGNGKIETASVNGGGLRATLEF